MITKIPSSELARIYAKINAATLSKADTTIVNDTTYGETWNGDTTHAPSKNAVYDKIETLGASSFSGDMDDIPDGTTYVKTENNFTDALASKLGGIAEGAEVNVQPDWNQATNTADDYIKNKPTSFGLTQPQIMARNLGC